MKIVSLSFSILGVICLLMACLTALKVSPAFTSDILDVGKTTVTTAFWGGLSALILIAAIAFGVIAGKE